MNAQHTTWELQPLLSRLGEDRYAVIQRVGNSTQLLRAKNGRVRLFRTKVAAYAAIAKAEAEGQP